MIKKCKYDELSRSDYVSDDINLFYSHLKLNALFQPLKNK